MENLIEVKNVYKSFGSSDNRTNVLKNVSLSVKKGEFIALMGASGSGKSTLLYLLGGLDKPDRGDIYINGENLLKLNDRRLSVMRRRNVGFVFQFFNLVQNLSVEDNILLPLTMDGKNPRDYKGKLQEILEITGLTDKRKKFPPQLSGGEQQRVAVARAILIEPDIILADEPTGNLDSRTGKEIMELFAGINRDKNITILMVTHSRECAGYADRIINLSDGEITSD